MANIQFYTTITDKKHNTAVVPIQCRFYAAHINQRANTHIVVPRVAWNEKDGCCIISKRYETPTNAAARAAQTDLNELAAFILTAYARQIDAFPADWLKQQIAAFHKPPTTAVPLADLINDYCNDRRVAATTRKKIQSLKTHLNNFAAAHYVLTTDLTAKDLQNFTNFLLYDESGNQIRAQNSVNTRLKSLRAILYYHGKPHPNPFDTFTMPTEQYGAPIYLTKEERDYLYLFPDLTPALKRQRDIFIFQCHIGCRIADLYALTPANITKDGWLMYIPQKTAKTRPQIIEVPLSPTALQIIERYKGTDKRGRLLPFVSMDKYNKSIQKVCTLANLDRPVLILDPITNRAKFKPLYSVVTSHTARKTFTQILYSQTQNKRLVAALSGHSENSTAFNRYSEITKEMKSAARDLLT